MTAADKIDIIRMKNIMRTTTLGLFAISIVAAFMFTLANSPEAEATEFISNIISVAIVTLVAYALLHILCRSAKDQEKETAEEPEKINEESDT